jgi:hypothetical protein
LTGRGERLGLGCCNVSNIASVSPDDNIIKIIQDAAGTTGARTHAIAGKRSR